MPLVRLIEEVKFKRDNRENDYQHMLLVGTVFFGLVIVLLFRGLIATIIVLLILTLQLINYYYPDGKVLIYQEDEDLLLSFSLDSVERKLKIKSKKFRWSYNHLSYSGNNAGERNSGHVNFILLRLEMELEDGRRLVLCQELNQWQSIPHDWAYEVFDRQQDTEVLLSLKNLKKIKASLEKTDISHN